MYSKDFYVMYYVQDQFESLILGTAVKFLKKPITY